MYITIITTYGLQLPVVFIGALWLRLESPMYIIWAMALSWSANALLTYIVFKRGRWKTVKV